MLYTMAFLLGAGSSRDSTDYKYVELVVPNANNQEVLRIFEGQPIPLPKTIVFGSTPDQKDLLRSITMDLAQDDTVTSSILMEDSEIPQDDGFRNVTAFAESAGCYGDTDPGHQVCVWMYKVNNDNNATLSLDLLFGGDESSATNEVLACTQQIVQQALYKNIADNSTTSSPTTSVKQIQLVPALESLENTAKTNAFFLIFPGIMLVLALTNSLQFLMAPLSTDKFTDRVRSFVLVGVKLRVYLHTWLLYLSLEALIPAAVLTMVSFVWTMFPASSPGLVFVSHYLALVHLNSVALLLTQIAPQEELTQGLPWLMAIISGAVGIAILLTIRADETISLTVLAIPSPFAGMMQYCAIYSNYDAGGLKVGIHAGDNVAESGLLGCYLAQLAGILIWNVALMWWILPKPSLITYIQGATNRLVDEAEEETTPLSRDADKFEPLHPDAEVLLEVKGLKYTYKSGFCENAEKSVEVLKGLDMDVCRGEVFGYLGHNSSGKTTSIGIMSGELLLQEGSITYNFSNGKSTVGEASDLPHIRQEIGICLQHNDALHEDLSAREFLTLFAKLKGNIPQNRNQSKEDAINAEVERRLADIKFTSSEDADKPIDTYSGGMKRKVCSESKVLYYAMMVLRFKHKPHTHTKLCLSISLYSCSCISCRSGGGIPG